MPGKKKAIHVLHDPNGGWYTKKEGNDRASARFDTKVQAEKAGRDQARQEKTELIIHNKHNVIERRDSYGNDPNPPKDKK